MKNLTIVQFNPQALLIKMKKILIILFILIWPHNVFAKQLSKFVFIPDDVYQAFNELPKEHKIQTCGFKYFYPQWDIINKDLAKKIEGHNSRMDNWREVEGEYSRDVFRKYSEAITYAMVSEDIDLKEKLFDKLYQWAKNEALTETTICYTRDPKNRVKKRCEGEWSDPNGQDLAPIKDATVSIEIVIGLNYIYSLFYNDYETTDARHQTIKNWFAKFYKRFPPYRDFYWGNSVGWSFPNIFVRHQMNKSYKGTLKSIIKGADRAILKDGSLKDRTTRGNRALWYHSSALGEAFMVLEMAYAAGLKLPKKFEPELLLAVELFHKTILDNSYITPWAKKATRGQFDPKNPHNQSFTKLDNLNFNGIWLHSFQYRYPDHPTTMFLKERLTTRAQSLRSDGYLGFGAGCIYNALANK